MHFSDASDMKGARDLGRLHGKQGLPWIAPEAWPPSMQGEYGRGFAEGIRERAIPLLEAAQADRHECQERVIELIAKGLLFERRERERVQQVTAQLDRGYWKWADMEPPHPRASRS